MLINDVLYAADYSEFEPIGESCRQFIEESGGFPMVKLLPQTYHDFQKVKIRKRKNVSSFANSFNEAFEHEMHQLRERSLFANGEVFLKDNINHDNTIEPFYVFPIDGYDFIYSKEITDSSKNYSTVFNEIFNQLGENSAEKVFADLVKFTYTSQNLQEGLESGAEIIVYGIPYYYAIRQTAVNDYNNLLTTF
jgi:hypothetical protein